MSVDFILHLIFIVVILSKLQCLFPASAASWRTCSELLGNYRGGTANRNEKSSAQQGDIEDVQGTVGTGVSQPGGVLESSLSVLSSEGQVLTQKGTTE